MGVAQRDPVSEPFDRAARALLERAYRARGGWAATRLADPTPAQLARWLLQGINVLGADPVTGGKGIRAPNRWARAYMRALWHQHKWYSAAPGGGWRTERRTTPRRPGFDVEFGRHRTVLGLIPAGYTVRVRYPAQATRRKRPLPEERRWADGGPRWADPAERDWEAFG